MLKVQEIREIIKLIDHSSIDEFTYESEGTKVKLKKNSTQNTTAVLAQPAPVAAPITPAPVVVESPAKPVNETVAKEEQKASAINDETLHKITSPMVGTFYKSSSPESPAYVQVGDKVSVDGVVCIVEAMKLFNEIEAEVSGEIVEILVNDGQLVEYGQPLFLVKAN
ncbi:acetyl-CoA carboxylase biotin carboxyl carrier protein [Paenisporosarcina indica]|uniref:acetyl-CoA carboxylase biotin carboxyl carrier protein n=1 Tax=Paenisporosarcina indica TaxID=650093 RepID=UPI0009502218|nr:acetyl-CoA carboxylase biotin carboxyl carrier protein [Paenisporosarcina indica]